MRFSSQLTALAEVNVTTPSTEKNQQPLGDAATSLKKSGW
jgi:hypothetical protein